MADEEEPVDDGQQQVEVVVASDEEVPPLPVHEGSRTYFETCYNNNKLLLFKGPISPAVLTHNK